MHIAQKTRTSDKAQSDHDLRLLNTTPHDGHRWGVRRPLSTTASPIIRPTLLSKRGCSCWSKNPTMTMMHRAKGYDSHHSMMNASWDELNPRISPSPLQALTAIEADNCLLLPQRAPSSSRLLFRSIPGKMSPAVERLIKLLFRDAEYRKHYRRQMVDESKLDNLLSMLRSNEFAGEVDPVHHSPYLQGETICLPKLLPKPCSRGSIDALHRHIKPKSQFKDALKKHKSSPAVSN